MIKAIFGAAIVILIQILANSKNFYIAGLVPLFPTFALISHFIVGRERSVGDLKLTILFGMFSLIPYFVYLLTLYCLVDRLSLGWSLLIAAGAWGISAGILLLLWN